MGDPPQDADNWNNRFEPLTARQARRLYKILLAAAILRGGTPHGPVINGPLS